jgi:hypothetical protein
MKSVFKLIEANGLTLHGDIEHFAELVRADEREQIALDKMAENARELGLDYEPVCDKDPQGCWSVRCQLGKKCKNTPPAAQPAPVQPMAHIVGEIDHAGKVWKPAQRQWVGLTDEEVAKIVDEQTTDNQGYDIWCDGQGVARAIEAKLKERNNA